MESNSGVHEIRRIMEGRLLVRLVVSISLGVVSIAGT